MEKIYTGKTKDVYKMESGNICLKFKDDVTGKDGVFDPGENQVGLKIDGAGREALKITKFFYELLNDRGIKTHYLSANIDDNTMEVKNAHVFGEGLEAICRFRAVGSFIRRYGKYIEDGTPLDAYAEITLKDDERKDPLITDEALEMLGILTKDEYKTIISMTKEIAKIVKEVLAEKGLDLYDIKFEFARDDDGEIMLIDEISGGSMRVYKGDKKLSPLEIHSYLI
ncbi:phosphoribosylaminoimidazolesuccinocarboxamide synthase [Neofamilia massiliensis]|uniref:phosphoribosylaminoimidazolesuccinocarboxamide synthase n=1 Tax=Neofamilia massiliensis TaxID=1673724 RepID=UPI0006BB6B06|nr:phosphoribosylaminoimidazolesuccinocarboxamide synthase [Neofamilia massiliensis]